MFEKRSGLALVLACAGMLLSDGCSTAAPRYRASPAERPSVEEGKKDEGSAGTVSQNAVWEDDREAGDGGEEENLIRPRVSEEALVDDTPEGVSRDRVLLNVISYLGVPYRHGGTTRDGIDCSAFTALIYSSAAERTIPRSTTEQFQLGTKVSRKDLRFGDLVFFNTTGRRPSHVGIYLENDLFVHASLSAGVTFSSLESTYYRKRYIGARRVLE